MDKVKLRNNIIAPLLLGGIFFASRLLYNQAGIQFRADSFTGIWHFIDINLLKTDLWRSIFYLHTQPPLMNLLTGIGLQHFPNTYAIIFQACFLLGGYFLSIAIYLLGNRIGIPNYLSMLLAVWFSISPATLVFENDLFYTYPVTVLLVLSGVFLARFLENKRSIAGLLFSLLLALNALTWGLFHIVWLLGCFGIVALLLKGNRRKAWWLAPAFLLVFAWYAKNAIVFDSFTASTWAGLNFFKTVTIKIPDGAREQWVNDGLVSELALVPPYRSAEVYLQYFPDTQLTGIPILDDHDKTLGGRNQHHLTYVYAGERYLKDAVRILMFAPQYYLRTIPNSLSIFFHSASDYKPTYSIRTPIDSLDTAWNRLFYGQWHKDETLRERSFTFAPDYVGWWLLLVFLIVVIATPVYNGYSTKVWNMD